MTLSISRKISYGFAFAFLVLLLGGLTSLYSTARLIRAGSRVQRTNDVLRELYRVRGFFVDEQTGTRGFALTGQDELLTPLRAARDRLPVALAEVRRLTADSRSQQSRLDELDQLAKEHLAFSDELTDLRRKGGIEPAAALVATGRGEQQIARVRLVVAQMVDEERRQLVTRILSDRAAARATYIFDGALAAIALVLVIAGSVLLTRAVGRPTARLLRGVERLGAGDLSIRIEEGPEDELGRLARAFNQMVDKRRITEEALARANALLEGLFFASPIAIVATDVEGKVDVWNPAAERTFGFRAEEVLGQPLPVIPAEEARDFEALRERVLGNGETALSVEQKRKRKDGSTFDARISAAPRVREGRLYGWMALVEDISEQKRAIDALRESEERFRLALEEAPIGMALIALDGRFVRVNRALSEILGYPPEELTGLTYHAITHPADLDADVALAGQLARGEIPRYQTGKRYIRKDGTIVDVMLSGAALRGPDGTALYYISQIEDITERKRAEEALRRSEEALSRAQRVAHLGSWERDLATGAVVRSAEVYRIYGIEPRDDLVAPEALASFVPDDDRDRVLATVEDAAKNRGSFSLEHGVVRPDGEQRVVRLQGECTTEPGGAVRMIGTILDITELKRAEHEREELVRWLRQVLEQTPIGLVLVHGPRGDRVEPNRRALEMIGRPIDSVSGYAGMVLSADGQPLDREQLPSIRALRGDSFTWAEYGLRDAMGRVIPVAAGATAVRDEDGNVVGAILAFQDITPVKDLERLRAEWNSVIAHDLRQPLGVINLGAQLLAAGETDPARATIIAQIGSSARRLERMIHDLLDLSRLDARQLTLSRTLDDLPALVRDSVDRVALGTMDRRFEVRIPHELPGVEVDADRIAQVMENLLTNAVKYGEPGTDVIVDVEPCGETVAVSVTNTGVGIRPSDVPRLFRRFHRTDEARRSGVKGIGLGLYITRELVEAHGGRITVESTPGGTTTFRFTLPAARAEPRPPVSPGG